MSKTQVITGVERRRKFTDEEKAIIVAEAMDGDSISAVARKHGIANSVLHSWKKKFPPKSFALVEVNGPEPKPLDAPAAPLATTQQPPSTPPQPQSPGSIRVIFQKRIVIEFPLNVEPSAIAQFIKALEG